MLQKHAQRGTIMNKSLLMAFFPSVLLTWSLLLIALVGMPGPAHADEPKGLIPVDLSVDVRWDMDEGRNTRKGHFRMNAKTTLNLDRTGSGLDQESKLTPFSLKYRGRTFTGSLHFEETLTQKETRPPNCSPVLESYSGSRSFSYSPPEQYDSINLMLRRFGITNSRLKSQVSGVGAQQFLAELQSQMKMPPSYYEFVAGGVSGKQTIYGKKRKMVKGECHYEKAEKEVFMSMVGLRFPIPEEGPIEGNQTWRVKLDGPPRNFSIKLSQTGVGKEKLYRPGSAGSGGNATFTISWSSKEISPELRILVRKENAWKDITDKREESICVGQKVSLKCEPLTGVGDSLSSVQWQIPGMPDLVVKGWEGSEAGSKKTPFTEGDCHDQTVEFAWIDGSFEGQEREITCTAEVKGKTLTRRTILKVYKPRSEIDISVANHVGFGWGDGCEMIPGSPSVEFESRAVMPEPFNNQRFCLFYIQLVQCNAWGLKRYVYPHYEWVNDVHEQMLDGAFPYNGYHCGASLSSVLMKDTPGFPLSAMASAYAHMDFVTYLMLMPPYPKSDVGIVAVPLKRLEWQWTGAAQAVGEPFPSDLPPCGWGHCIVGDEAPVKNPPIALDCNKYPEWKETKVEGVLKSTRQMTTNREELPPTDTDWGIKKQPGRDR